LQGSSSEDTQAIAEHELMLLWSSIERDMNPQNGRLGACTQELGGSLEMNIRDTMHPTSEGAIHDGQQMNPFYVDLTGDEDPTATTPESPTAVGAAADATAALRHEAQSLVHRSSSRLHLVADAAEQCIAREASHQTQLDAPGTSADPKGYVNGSFLFILWQTLQASVTVFASPARKAATIAVVLAFFNQISASTSIINYAPEIFKRVGVTHDVNAVLYTSMVAAAKTMGVLAGVPRDVPSSRYSAILYDMQCLLICHCVQSHSLLQHAS
jgi:hypothetical protein